jgi:hypothetical protein
MRNQRLAATRRQKVAENTEMFSAFSAITFQPCCRNNSARNPMAHWWKKTTALTIMITGLALTGHAQVQVFQPPYPGRGTPPQPPPKAEVYVEPNARGTKMALDRALKNYPPSLTQILQLDPSLLSNPEYLAPYPKVAQFIKDHPAILHNTPYYIGTMRQPSSAKPTGANQAPFRGFDNLVYYVVILTLLAVVAWLIRATVDQRRSIQISRARMDAQMRILERFTSNEDLLSFIQTPAGRQFLESASMPAVPRAVAAPVAQILHSNQAGFVLLTGGIGMQFVTAQYPDSRLLSAIGVVAIATGVGFIVSAVSSYSLSRKLGLLTSSPVNSQTPSS